MGEPTPTQAVLKKCFLNRCRQKCNVITKASKTNPSVWNTKKTRLSFSSCHSLVDTLKNKCAAQ